MKISEKQVLRLISIAKNMVILCDDKKEYPRYATMITVLLDEIINQQSDELREVE